jgi:membrane-associated phospholipid phosphatase
MRLIHALTGFGDIAVIAPAALIVCAVVARYQSRLAGLWLLGALAGCALVIAALKVLFGVCFAVWGGNIYSPSGHAGMSVAFYGAVGMIASRQSGRIPPMAILAAAALLISGIALSRVLIGAHTVPEVWAGLLVGTVALVVFACGYYRLRVPAFSNLLLLGPPALIAVLLAGHHLQIEHILHEGSRLLGPWRFVCG